MGIGGCVVLIGLGAVLTFAVDWEVSAVNLDLVGLIMMAVGILGLAVFSSVLRRPRRTTALGPGPVPGETVVEERHYYGDRGL